jgi:hypothetical protein
MGYTAEDKIGKIGLRSRIRSYQLIDRELRNRLKSSNTCSKRPKNWPLGINEYFREMNNRPGQNRRINEMKLMDKHLIVEDTKKTT